MKSKTKSNVDPVMMAILANRVDGILREMTNTLLQTARSGVINSARDFSCSICTGKGDLFAVAEGLPIHIFGSGIQAKKIVTMHKDLKEGDCYLDNDPYHGNTHAADHTFLVPIYWGGEHLFTAIAKAHQADVGNSLPTTYMATAKDIYEEGALIFSATRIQRDYKMNEDLIRMMEKRIRVPSQWFGDFLAGISSVRIAEKRFKEMFKKYGKETIKEFIEKWMDYSELRMVQALKSLPSKQISGKAKHDPTPFLPQGIPLQVQINIENKAAKVEIDLTKNIDNVECGYNQSEATAISSVMAGLFNCLDPDIPKNAGSFRRVNVKLREGCVTGKPLFPASCSVATTNVSDRMVNLTGHTMSKLGNGYGLAESALGLGIGMAVVSGLDPRKNNEPFVNQLHLTANGGPASSSADGWATFGLPVIAGLMYRDSIEVDELKHPMEIRKLALIPGSAGAGKYRGGLSLEIEICAKANNFTVIYPGDGQEYPPRGARGGQDGLRAERWVVRKSGSKEKLGNAQEVTLNYDDVVKGRDCSGGGYGNPRLRNKLSVLTDVEDGFETIARAQKLYHVIIKSDSSGVLTIDENKTKKLRSGR